MNLAVLVMLVALLAYASDHSGAQDAERVIPVFEEPRHRLVFQAEATRILHLQVYPGDTSLFHTHAEPILYVAFKTAETSTQNPSVASGRRLAINFKLRRRQPPC